MLCSARELGLSDDHAGLLELADDAPPGADIRQTLALDDTLFTLKLTPNLAHCLSIVGIAREVSALTGAPLNLPSIAPVAAKHEDRVPVRIEATAPTAGGDTDEKAVLRSQLQSSYVCRIRDNSNFAVAEERPLTEAARAAGVMQDAVVRLGMGSKPQVRPHHPVRLVVVAVQPHAKRGGRKGKTAGPASTGRLLIATNLVDVPAEVVALIYRQRWLIEIFFRFFKHVLGCRHLLSAQPDGIAIQAYCALIACLRLWPSCRRQQTKRQARAPVAM